MDDRLKIIDRVFLVGCREGNTGKGEQPMGFMSCCSVEEESLIILLEGAQKFLQCSESDCRS